MLSQIVRNYEIIADVSSAGRHFSGNSAAIKQIVRYVYSEKEAQRSLLDIGFGVGELGQIIKTAADTQHWHVDGIDGFFETCCNVDMFNNGYYRNIWHGLAQDIPAEQLASYDMLCLLDVIEHLDPVTAKELLRSLLEALGEQSFLVLSTPLWFYPQDHNKEGDLEEHLIGIPASSLLQLQPVMYCIEANFLIGSFVFTKKSLQHIDKFVPTTDRSFDLQAGRKHLADIGVKADNVLYFVRD